MRDGRKNRRADDGRRLDIAVWKYSRFGRSRDGVAVNLKRLEGI